MCASCASCWAAHRRCHRPSASRRCTKCSMPAESKLPAQYTPKPSIKAALRFPNTVMQERLYKKPLENSTLIFDAHGRSSDIWSLLFHTSANRVISFSFENGGVFATDNEALIATLDEEIRRSFSADLTAKQGDAKLIEDATLAGGYAHCLLSTNSTNERVQTVLEGITVDLDYTGHSAGGSFKCILFSRLGHLVEHVIQEIRLINAMGMPAHFYSSAYAAAVILHHEVNYFQSNLRHGCLRDQMLTSLPDKLLTWLMSVEDELSQHIQAGCKRFPSWRAAIRGSMKKFRTQRGGETLAMSINLLRNMSSLGQPVLSDDWYTADPALPFNEGSASLDLSEFDALETPLWATVNYDSSSGDSFYNEAAATSNSNGEMLSKVPRLSSATGVDNAGQMSYYFSTEADYNLFSGIDVPLTSKDLRLVSSDWMTFSDPHDVL